MELQLPSCSTTVSLRTSFCISLATLIFVGAMFVRPLSAQQQEWPKQQTSELMAFRCSTSPAERKLSFNLLLISRDARHAALGSFASSMDSSSVNPDGTVNVEVIAYLSPSLMAAPVMADVIRTNGAISVPAYISDHLQVRVTQTQLLDLAANPNVLSIRDANASTTASRMVAANTQPARSLVR